MQILHSLLKIPHDLPCASSRACHDEVKRRDLVVYNGAISGEDDEGGAEDDTTLTFVLRAQNGRTCFYGTLRLKYLRSLFKSQEEEEGGESRMGHKTETVNVGCKVLPICDAVSTGSNGSYGSDKDKQRSERTKAVSRMKELLRWAAAAKSSKGGSKAWKALYFRHKVALKAETDDSSSTSSEISFKWDGGSCSSASSVRSPLSLASTSRNDRMVVKNPSRLSVRRQSPELDPNLLGSPKSEDHVRNGQWITTDSEFVVLEL
ncbi:uncharacterized protein LOC135675594 [Musa acuminata AAA Group]|uniref:uncharacterized protein LOC135675594 n=1 Tax=Musa acuminata AAA Group TaxID=214697 RepID=UPI0031DD1F5B